MTAEQARAYVAGMPSEAEMGVNDARECWENGAWARLFITGYDLARLFGRAFEEAFWRAIEGLKTLDPEKAAADLAMAREETRREKLAEEEKRRRRAEERAAKKRVNPAIKNPLLPRASLLPIVSSRRWMKQRTR